MAITHDKSWDVIADKATVRRAKENVSWEEYKKMKNAPVNTCLGCGNPTLSKAYPKLCDHCVKQAYDILESMEK